MVTPIKTNHRVPTVKVNTQARSVSDFSRKRIALVNLGMESEKVRELKDYYREGITIDYPEYPTQLAFIFSFLKQQGYEIELFDWALHKWVKNGEECTKEVFHPLDNFAPHLILIFSKGYNLKEVEQIVSIFKDRVNVPKYILMSYAAGVSAPETLQRMGEYVPIITYGETEPFIESLVENSKNKMGHKEIWEAVKRAPNIAYLTKNKSVVINPLIFSDLNKLPFPDFSIDGAEEYLKINNYIPIALSRGCPYNCRHCPTKKIYGGKWRGIHLDKVYNLLHVIKDSTRDENTIVALTDNNLVYDSKWFREVCRMFNEMHITWDCRLRPDWVTEEVAENLASGKCAKVILSADVLYDYEPALASFLRKPLTLDSLKKASAVCHEAGMQVGIYFIVDFYKEPESVLPKIAGECNVNSITLSCLHDYNGFNSSRVVSPAMKKVIDVMERNGSKVNICTGWGETSW